ncbi:malto-oligosyltrehalose synthase [Chondromyces apiculatus]|uniref:Malto-oligosyltrehalose synthase n=1 Tax=Chondromyces apiculatus DSM 436 TaxID=1192034 RepID=A0A017T4V1_9BACT|nr:malto-oligosyltrehalose synthase [Chondromyces apiculatus]EYF04298.1 Malto-oligosyltrehalose synthase [Chondromyces apiculatus DSM 436]
MKQPWGGEFGDGSDEADRVSLEQVATAERVIDEVSAQLVADIPRATYRVQLNGGFTFQDARRWAGYLADLGVSHLYSSPFFKAMPGSNHGYDLTDHNALNPEIGTREDLDTLSATLREHGMGLVLDFVPNHMGIGVSQNAWWADVLENGPSSLHAPYFDIDWDPVKPELRNKVLLPILGDHYGHVLERGELRVESDGGAFFLRYYDNRFPLNPRTYTTILEPLVPLLSEKLGAEHDAVMELLSILTGLRNLPVRTETQRSRVMERRREKEILKRRLANLVAEMPAVERALREGIARMNGTVGEPRSFDALDRMLEEQAYRLSYWRTAAEEINYRRFFDINDLAAIRMENPAVYEAAHRLIIELFASGQLTGLRIDHPDGLWDPIGYFSALQRSYFLARCATYALQSTTQATTQPTSQPTRERQGGGAPSPRPSSPTASPPTLEFAARYDARLQADPRSVASRKLYLVVEKILSRGETLPDEWAVYGTSGYEFGRSVGALFVDPASEAAMTTTYERFIGERHDFEDLVYEKKQLILNSSLSSELNVLAHALNRITERDRHLRDFTLGSLTDALREVIACFPVYRTYINERTTTLSDHDRVAIHRAIGVARRRNPTTEGSVFSFVRSVLTLDPAQDVSDRDRALWREFVMKFQQLSGPVMAKGLEDTTFYIYNRLVSLNEVGGEPERYGLSIAAFHRENATRQRAWPNGLLGTSTHDTKRSEDVRARISVLSEVPGAWEEALAHATAATVGPRADVDGRPAPDPNEEYLLYQTLIGSMPLVPLLDAKGPSLPEGDALATYVDRVVAYMRKATKEAKVNTSWIQPSPDYDAAVEAFVRTLLAPSAALQEILPVARVAAYHGMWGALSQVLLKLTSPGVPDLYQGTELWDDSLVDPDNRRPVDFEVRARALAEIRARSGEPTGLAALAKELFERAEDGHIKLFVIHRALEARRRAPELFGDVGAYVPLMAGGERADHVVAFARRAGDREIVVVAPRFTAKLMEGKCAPPLGDVWRGTWIPTESGARYTDLLTGAVIRAVDMPEEARQDAPKEAANDAQAGASLSLDGILHTLPVALLARGLDQGAA